MSRAMTMQEQFHKRINELERLDADGNIIYRNFKTYFEVAGREDVELIKVSETNIRLTLKEFCEEFLEGRYIDSNKWMKSGLRSAYLLENTDKFEKINDLYMIFDKVISNLKDRYIKELNNLAEGLAISEGLIGGVEEC